MPKQSFLQKKMRLMFAFWPVLCQDCKELIWFRLYYGMPWYQREARQMGPFRNEVHCKKCHDCAVRANGKCVTCEREG